MTDTTTADKPEALRLADALEREAETNIVKYSTAHKAAKELRRLYVRLQEAESAVTCAQVIGWLDDLDIEVTDKELYLLFPAARAKEGKA